MKQPSCVFTDGKIALGRDLVFGVVVLTESGWMPVSDLDTEDKATCRELLGNNPACPADLAEALR